MESPGTLTSLLYHKAVRGAAPRIAVGSLLAVALLAPVSTAPAMGISPADRLDRFRELAGRIDPGVGGPLGEVYALLDGEVVESLAGGGVFASPAFVRERLEAFAEAWGGLSISLLALERSTVAAFSFTELPHGSTVRVYGRTPGGAVLRAALAEDGWPIVQSLPPGGAGARQFLVTWEGTPASDGTRPLLFEVVREDAAGVRVTWNSSTLFPEGLTARWYVVRGREMTVRHAAHYPGWTPGCEGQTEYEDVYRMPAAASTFVRASRRQLNGWHREVHAVAERLFAALARGDRASVGALVPDVALRARLPASLRHEAACERSPGPDGTVALAAVAGERDPWTVTFRRAAGRWQLTGATPMVP
jgi:hypothetical protein